MTFWDSVRREFRTDPDLINLAHFLFASHPRPVRAEIDRLGKWLDFNTSVLDMKSIPENFQKAADAARISTAMINTPDEVDKALRAVAELTQ